MHFIFLPHCLSLTLICGGFHWDSGYVCVVGGEEAGVGRPRWRPEVSSGCMKVTAVQTADQMAMSCNFESAFRRSSSAVHLKQSSIFLVSHTLTSPLAFIILLPSPVFSLPHCLAFFYKMLRLEAELPGGGGGV